MLVGRKSESSLEAGYIFAPYIPMQVISTVVDGSWKRNNRKRKIEDIFNLPITADSSGYCPSKAISSRYATKVVNNNFYEVIKVKNPSN